MSLGNCVTTISNVLFYLRTIIMLESSLVRSKAFMVGLLKHSTSYDIGAVCSDYVKNTVNSGKIRLSSNSFCKKDYSEINKNPYAKNNCFGGNYINALLTERFGLGRLK
ncbi:hypothetical protein pdam_00024199, partial [Pocillopora damicornis]